MSGFEAILLAAGASSRMGVHKALIRFGGVPLVVHQIREFLATRIDRLVVVLGADAPRIADAIRAACAPGGRSADRLILIVNHGWRSGKCSSIRTGVDALSKDVRHVAVHSVDQPTRAEALDALFGRHLVGGMGATVPGLDGRRGHPLCLSAELVPLLSSLREEEHGLRGLLRRLETADRLHVAELRAPCIRWNLNRPEDLDRLRGLISSVDPAEREGHRSPVRQTSTRNDGWQFVPEGDSQTR